MIAGVAYNKLPVFSDERGSVMHMLRRTDSYFTEFGEIYFSSINPGIAKAWQRHKTMSVNVTIPVGSVTIVLWDGRENSATYKQLESYTLAPDNHALLTIPPGIWYGYFSNAAYPSLIANCASQVHQADEQEKLPCDTTVIPYTHQFK